MSSLIKTLLLGVCASVALVSSNALAVETPSFGENVQFRGNLDNARVKFERDKRGRVAFIGGSITEMDGYRPMVCQSLKERFPNTEFTFIAAGISSTCSTTGAFRVESDVLKEGPVDLFFVEFAVNDDQDAHHTRTQAMRGMEAILRKALKSNPRMDMVMTFFVNPEMLATHQAGGVPLTVEAHETVAAHYGVSTIHLAREVARQITEGSLTWKQFGGVHPAPHGNAICARMIDDLLNRAWKKDAPVANPVPYPLPKPLDPLNYEFGRYLGEKEVELLNGWNRGVLDWKGVPGSKRARFNELPVWHASSEGSTARITFEGTAVGAFVLAGPDAGIAEVSIDGAAPREVNLYHAHSKGLHYPRSVLFGEELPKGKHVLTLRVSDKTTSAGHAIRALQFFAN
jgi:lysophospholipase L1-like esterase